MTHIIGNVTATLPESAPTRQSTPPNYWVGFLLNVLAAGAGFTYLGRVRLHMLWLALTVGLGVVSALGGSAAEGLALLGGWGLLIGGLVLYRKTFLELEGKAGWSMTVAPALKWGLIGLHLVSAVALRASTVQEQLIGLQSAQQNVRSAEERASQMLHKVSVASIEMVLAEEGGVPAGDCMTAVHKANVSEVTACEVLPGSLPDGATAIRVTFEDGTSQIGTVK